MKPQTNEQKSAEVQTPARKPRFQILMLEERIAPNKGGIPNGGSGGNACHRDPICK